MDKIRVFGKAQDRTALGTIHVYMIMYPHATLAGLRKAFPSELNLDKGVPETFIYADEKGTTANWNGCFGAPDELLTTGDDKKVALVNIWTKPSFEKIVRHVTQCDIVVAEFEKAGRVGEKDGSRLEYLGGYIPPVVKKKELPWWLWLIIALLLVGGIVTFLLLRKPEAVEVEEVVTVEKVVYRDRVGKTEKDFNATKFVQGRADLTDEIKFVLRGLAKLMEVNPDLRLKIKGYASEEGDEAFSQRFSEEQAQAAIDSLISQGISTDRS